MVGDASSSLGMPANGSVPYYYADTEDDRVRASKDITTSPIPITEAGLASGKLLYNINCAICHGEKGDGAGYLARDGSKYPVAPANFKQDTFYHSSNGRFYHAIMFGRNLMGSYADKLSYQERWQVIQYIRSLQAKDKNFSTTRRQIPLIQISRLQNGHLNHPVRQERLCKNTKLPLKNHYPNIDNLII